MPLPTSGPAPRTLSGSVKIPALLLSALALLIALPAGAGAEGNDKSPAHPEKDWMGSTLSTYERDGKAASKPETLTSSVNGVDVSSHNGTVDWPALKQGGVRFAYVKATEGTSYTNPYFAQQYNGSYKTGMIRGAYHFALPASSSGAAQATYFVAHGGGWSSDGKTLPGALDVEYNPYGAACYGKSPKALVSWIADFSRTYHAKTRRYPVIYTSTTWWKRCTGNVASFSDTNPLWIPNYSSSAGALPAGWHFHTFWQYTPNGSTVGDRNRFNGAYDRLKVLATR